MTLMVLQEKTENVTNSRGEVYWLRNMEPYILKLESDNKGS